MCSIVCVCVCVLQNSPPGACNLEEEMRCALGNNTYYKRNTFIKHLLSAEALQISYLILSILEGRYYDYFSIDRGENCTC